MLMAVVLSACNKNEGTGGSATVQGKVYKVIHADDDCRKRRIGRKYDISESDAGAMIVDNDYSRELYTKTFTGSEWQDARNYDLSINVRKFGVNGAVDFIMSCIE